MRKQRNSTLNLSKSNKIKEFIWKGKRVQTPYVVGRSGKISPNPIIYLNSLTLIEPKSSQLFSN